MERIGRVTRPSLTGFGRPPTWDGVVVLCAANNWDGIKLADQHMAEHLRAHAPVLYVDPPMSRLTPRNRPELRAALEGPRLRELAPGLARLTPVVPPKGRHRLVAPFTDRLLRHGLRRALDALGAKPRAVIVTQPSWPAFGAGGEELAVFWAQDDFAGGAGLMGLDAARVEQAELAAARHADLIVTSSPAVRDTWARRGFDSVMIPFGCDARAFGADPVRPAPDVALPSPVAGFIGHINSRIDLALLEAVADTMSLLLVGPRTPTFEPARLDRLLARPGVQWVGPQPFDRLPPYLAAIDVGLVPYDRGAFNIGSFPLKTLEYLAGGVPVVATDLPSTRWLATDLVVIEDAPARYAAEARSAARSRRDATEVDRRRRFARGHDWARRAEDMAQLLASGAGSDPRRSSPPDPVTDIPQDDAVLGLPPDEHAVEQTRSR
jgi:teichuronic acid biosynthesis glycosyltransferase TuaH